MRDDLRRALTWPLYSVRRLLATLLTGLALLVLVSVLTGGDQEPGGGGAKASRSSDPARSSASPSPSPTSSPDLSAAIDTGREFVAAWASHKKDRQAWRAGLEPYVTEQFAAKLASTDPGNIEPTEAVKAKNVDTGGDHLTQVAVTTDAETVSVRLMWHEERWWVYGLDPGAQAVG